MAAALAPKEQNVYTPWCKLEAMRTIHFLAPPGRKPYPQNFPYKTLYTAAGKPKISEIRPFFGLQILRFHGTIEPGVDCKRGKR